MLIFLAGSARHVDLEQEIREEDGSRLFSFFYEQNKPTKGFKSWLKKRPRVQKSGELFNKRLRIRR